MKPADTPAFCFSQEEISAVRTGINSYLKSTSARLNSVHFDLDDFFQECWVELLLNYASYDPKRGTLTKFSFLCARHVFCRKMGSYSRRKDFLEKAVSLSSENQEFDGPVYCNRDLEKLILLDSFPNKPISFATSFTVRDLIHNILDGHSIQDISKKINDQMFYGKKFSRGKLLRFLNGIQREAFI